nr:MerR family transcriptional regulator [Microbacterium sp. C448]
MSTSPAPMHIGEVAERTSLSLRTLRHYDEIGLIVPSGRTEGGFRLYTEEDVARIMLVRRMKPLGYSLDEMRTVLDAFGELARDPASVEHLAAIREIRDAAEDRRRKLVEQVAMAEEFLDQLASVEAPRRRLPPRAQCRRIDFGL